MRTRVLLVDDHQLLLDGLSSLLEKEAGIEVAGRAKDGVEAVELATRLKPDLVIMDLTLPRLSGIEAARRIRSELPDTRILCLSMHAEKQFVTAALAAGVAGYVLKERPLETVIEAIHAVMAGNTYICDLVKDTVVEAYCSAKDAEPSRGTDRLTHRERQVLQHLAEGHSTQDIAALLHLSPKTVGSHRDNIKDKLDIHSVAGLTKYAIRHGLTTTEKE